MNAIKKIVSLGLIITLVGINFSSVSATKNEDTNSDEVGATLPEDTLFLAYDEDGKIVEMDTSPVPIEKESFFSSLFTEYTVTSENTIGEDQVQETFSTYEAADAYFEEHVDELVKPQIMKNSKVVKVKNGVVNFRTKTCDVNTLYTEATTARRGYTNGCYGGDGAYLETSADGTMVKFVQSGVVGWVNNADVQVLNYDTNDVKSVNYYVSKNGKFFHYYTINPKVSNYYVSTLGDAVDFLAQNTAYYSYDGHYFYTTYEAMLTDYRNDTRANAVNKDPYYAYHQFLPQRSTSDVTAAQYEAYLKSATSEAGYSISKMKGIGNAFIDAQNTYGVNAAMMFGVASFESAWGTSSIAQSKNNLFGHKAYDLDPGQAGKYPTPSDSVYSHAKTFISIGYADPLDVSGRYFGTHGGDKLSGIGVKYASDPYWGEKSATTAYLVEKSAGLSQKYTVGIIEGSGTLVNIRKEPSTSSPVIYQNAIYNTSKGIGSYPVIILETVKGTSVGGNDVWYKIQSDPTLRDDRTALTQDVGIYNFDRDYVYIHSGSVRVVNGEVTPPDGGGGEVVPPEDRDVGDVNGDGRISTLDYVLVKNHILGIKLLDEEQQKYADMNGDGRISTLDYVLIKNYILNK